VFHKFERTREEAVVTYFKILSPHLPGITEINHGKPVITLCVPAEIRTRYNGI
jgi:hypothetical protein